MAPQYRHAGTFLSHLYQGLPLEGEIAVAARLPETIIQGPGAIGFYYYDYVQVWEGDEDESAGVLEAINQSIAYYFGWRVELAEVAVLGYEHLVGLMECNNWSHVVLLTNGTWMADDPEGQIILEPKFDPEAPSRPIAAPLPPRET